jgi:hypothetical protein
LVSDPEQVVIDKKLYLAVDCCARKMVVRVGRGQGRRGRLVSNAELREEVRTLRARLDALETSIHHEHTGDTSDEEILEEEEETIVETPEVRVLRSIFGVGSNSRAYLPFFGGSLNPEESIDWINAMNKHFNFSKVKEDKQVRFVVTRLRGHASLWWDGVQEERILKNKARINSWSRMTAKLRGKRLPKDYQLILFRKMKNLKQIQ